MKYYVFNYSSTFRLIWYGPVDIEPINDLIYIYIYIYIGRERQRERERELNNFNNWKMGQNKGVEKGINISLVRRR